jgi:hypothetical protein
MSDPRKDESNKQLIIAFLHAINDREQNEMYTKRTSLVCTTATMGWAGQAAIVVLRGLEEGDCAG